MAVDPTGEGLKRFLAEDPGGPVVMLNLPHFRSEALSEAVLQATVPLA
ncbi:hypothetical protein AB0L25_03830 [Spirillospora sp. NPDC052242]